MKTCTRCFKDKDDSEFRLRRETRGKKGGGKLTYLNNTCKQCDSELSNRYYFQNRDNPEFKHKWLNKSKEYYNSHKEEIKAKMKIKRQTPEYKAMMKKYRADHKEKILKDGRRRNKKYINKHAKHVTEQYVKRLNATAKYQQMKHPNRSNAYEGRELVDVQTRIYVSRLTTLIKKLSKNEK